MLKQSLRGKLSVYNNKGKVVAHLTISVSCRNHTRDFVVGQTGYLNRTGIPVVFSSGQASDKIVMPTTIQQKELNKWKYDVGASVNKNRLYKTHDILQHIEKLTVACSTTETSRINRVQNSVIEQPYNFNQDLGEAKGHGVHRDPSEITALKIAEYKKKRDDSEGNGSTSVVNHGTNFESKQPNPILYTGHNIEAEVLWNKKMLGIGEHVIDQVDTECHIWKGLKKKSCSEHKTIPKGRRKTTQHYSEVKHAGSFAPADVHKRKTKRIDVLSPVDCSSVRMKQSRSIKPLHHPSGWLCSDPVAALQQYKHFSNPKLNRTSLLRRAKLDPQLAHQLHAEIHYQVKQHLKHLGEGFEVALAKIKSKKFLKENACGKLTVGCQTEDGWGANLLNLYNPRKSCTQKNGFSSIEDEQYKEKRKNLVCKNEQRFQDGLDICLEKKPGMRENERVRMSELKRNLTKDIELAKLQAGSKFFFNGHYKDFELSTDSESFCISNIGDRQSDDNPVSQSDTNNNSQRPSVAELQAGSKESLGLCDDSESVRFSYKAVRPTNINNCIPLTDMNISQERSPSLSVSVSLSEPKLELKGQKPTNRLRDGKAKAVDTGSKILAHSEMIVREHSQDTALTYTVHKDLPVQNTSKVITCESDRYFTQNVQLNPKHNNDSPSAIKNLRPADDTVSSQTSEVSETSKLSIEVFQEILKGRHADFLVRNGSQLHVSEKKSSIPEETDMINEFLSASADNKLGKGHFAAAGSVTCSEEFLENTVKHNETDMISKYVSDCRLPTSCKPIDKTRVIDKSVTRIMKGIMMTGQDEGHDKGGAVVSKLTKASSTLENCNELQTASEKSSIPGKQYKREGASSQGMDDFDSSISDISARIAALLMPKRVSVAQLNTDSVSSYVPSDVSDTLSSLSDMVGD